jgi:hypothetical protein
MKLLLTALTALAIPAFASDPPEQVGRYQLVCAATKFTTENGSVEEKGLWKIDTVTGQVWKYYNYFVKHPEASRPPFVELADDFEPIETKDHRQ